MRDLGFRVSIGKGPRLLRGCEIPVEETCLDVVWLPHGRMGATVLGSGSGDIEEDARDDGIW